MFSQTNKPGERLRIVLAEDNPSDVTLVRLALAEATIECTLEVVRDGETAFLKTIHAGASRMEMLVRDLLAYTQAGRMLHSSEPQDVEHILRAALENLRTSILESGATIECGPMPSVLVHPMHLQQLFQNLVGNAVKYRRPGTSPRIRVTADRIDGAWQFAVRDDGIGIKPEYRERIFGLFKRLHTADEYSGTGIGLSLCERIVERYHGRIWVESEFGHGSTFYFTLPA